jgi:hypothetical protein
MRRLEANFPRTCRKFPEFLRLMASLAAERKEQEILKSCQASLENLAVGDKGLAGFVRNLPRYLHWMFPHRKLLTRVWRRKHRIPGKVMDILMRLATGRSSP